MSVLRIAVRLQAPIVMTADLHLDGLLLAVHPDAEVGPIARDCAVHTLPRLDTGIQHVTARGVRLPLASVAEATETARPGRTTYTRRRDAIDLQMVTRPFHVGLGPGRSLLKRPRTIETPSVTWWAVGSRQRVAGLVGRITHIGSLRAHGYGAVAPGSWTVEAVEGEALSVLVHEGRARRHLPASWCAWAETTETVAVHGPYWHPDTWQAGVRAGTRLQLAPEIEAVVRAAR